MIKVVNQSGLSGEVLRYIQNTECNIHLLIWCQYGTYCSENVRDVIDEYAKSSGLKVRLTVNDDESADIPAFIQESIRRKAADEKLIVVTALPWGREAADSIMCRYEAEFNSLRYQADAEEWVNLNFSVSNFNKPIIGFLKEHPEHLVLPYGEKPMPNSVGPCPASWADVDFTWSDQYYRNFDSWKTMKPEEKMRHLLLSVAVCIGNYEPLISDLHNYLKQYHGYDDLLLPSPPPESCNECRRRDAEAEMVANFRNIF